MLYYSMAKEKKGGKECHCSSAVWLWIPAGLFIGMGLGILINQLGAGMFVGLGLGFAAVVISRAFCKCGCNTNKK
jgi:hypothetical protein